MISNRASGAKQAIEADGRPQTASRNLMAKR
jgi:hypothetical protein